MNEDNNNYIGNSSSIFKTVGLIIAGYTTPWLIKMLLLYCGVDLSGQQTEIMQTLGVIIGVVLSYIDMKFTNSFFKRNITLEDYIAYGEKHFDLSPVAEEEVVNKVESSNKDFVDYTKINDYDSASEYEKL